MNNWNKILNELSYRVSTGIPDLSNEQHLIKLWDILKEHKWSVDARVELLRNLEEERVKRVPGTTWKTKSGWAGKRPNGDSQYGLQSQDVAQAYVDGKQVDKTTDPKNIKKKEKPESTFTTKELKEIDTLKQKTYTEEITYSDKDFDKKNKQNETPIKINFDDEVFKKLPKKYVKLLERVLNTGIRKFNPDAISKKGKGAFEPYGNALEKKIKGDFSNTPLDFTYFGIPKEEAGQGATAAQMGEIMTMMFSTLRPKELMGIDKDESGKFKKGVAGKIIQHLKELNAKGIQTAIDPSWVQAALDNRSAIFGHIRSEFGNNYEVVANSWDNKKEVESLGLDYDDKQGSTDMFMKIKDKDGKEHLMEVSLKKSFDANLYNGGVGDVIKGIETVIDLPDFTKRQSKRLDDMSKKYQKDFQELYGKSDNNPLNTKEGQQAIVNVATRLAKGKADVTTKNINAMEEMFSRMFEDLQSNPDLIVDRDYIGNITQQGSKNKSGFTTDKRDVQKSLLMMNEVLGELNPKSDVNNDIKEHRKETSKFEELIVSELNDNPEFKQSALDKCKEKLPLQDILEGKEVMAVGDTIISKKTLKKALGTDDWEKVKESLVVETDPSPRLVYKGQVDGRDRKFSFGDVVVREDGKGYSSSIKFEIKFNKDLKDFTSKASEDVIGRQRNVFDPTIGS
jgi:hypothetical protein